MIMDDSRKALGNSKYFFDLGQFFENSSNISAEKDEVAIFNAAAEILDEESWRLLSSIVRSSVTHKNEYALRFFEERLGWLEMRQRQKVLVYIFRPLLSDRLFWLLHGTFPEPKLNIRSLMRPLGDLLVYISNHHQIHDFALLLHYLDSIRANFENDPECLHMQPTPLGQILSFIDTLPLESPFRTVLQALNQGACDPICKCVRDSCHRLLSVDSSVAREEISQCSALDALYTLIVNSRDSERFSEFKVHKSTAQSSVHLIFFESAALHVLVEVLFDILYPLIDGLGGASVVRSVVGGKSQKDRCYWMDILFTFAPKIPLTTRALLARSLESLFGWRKPQKAASQYLPGASLGDRHKDRARVTKIDCKPATRREKTRRQSAQIAHLVYQMYPEDDQDESSELEELGSGKSTGQTRKYRKKNGEKYTEIAQGNLSHHDDFVPFIGEIRRYDIINDILFFHAQMTGNSNPGVVQSWKKFCTDHGITLRTLRIE